MNKDVNRQIYELLLAVANDEVCFEDKQGDEWELGKYDRVDGELVFWLASWGKPTEYYTLLELDKRLVELLQ